MKQCLTATWLERELNIVDYGRSCIDLPDINIGAVTWNDIDLEIVEIYTSDLELVADKNVTAGAGLVFGKVNVGFASSDLMQIAVVNNKYKFIKCKDLDHRWDLICQTCFLPPSDNKDNEIG